MCRVPIVAVNFISLSSNKMATVIIQARLGSTRFPNKVEQVLPNKKRIIDSIIDTALSSNAKDIVVVTPDAKLMCTIDACQVYLWGGERDVLGEFWFAAKNYEDDIIRLTADCPLVTPEIINHVLDEYLGQDVDYLYNSHDDYNPANDGFDVEIFSFQALKEAYEKATTVYDREHVTSWIVRNKKTAYCKMELPEGCSVNTYADYIKVCQLMEHSCKEYLL